jgi:glycosyltransferase involved in cell wall biosynthesis/TolA-binding protein
MDDQPAPTTVRLVFDDLAVLTAFPSRLTDIASWHEHIPFAFWLMRELKPSTYVELGVHKGDSYSAICQTVKEAGLATRCYGVDTWQGEEHAGRYDDSIWQEYSAYHRQHFAGFSSLIRSTFDEALEYFQSESVDLIHIDGRHFYEDVKHDFESWLPKLRPQAAVLFHDINVRERGFGVWRYWEELCGQFPGRTFSFVHGHGLGVLFPGTQPPALAARLCDLSPPDVHYVRAAFAALGKSISRQAEINRLTQQTRHLESRLDHAERTAQTVEEGIAGMQDQLRALHGEAEQRRQFDEARAAHETQLAKEVRLHEQQVARLTAWLNEREEQTRHLQDEVSRAQRQVDEVMRSRSWRAMAPARGLANALRVMRPGQGAGTGRPGLGEALRARRDLYFGSALELLRSSSLFDAEFYLARNPDLRASRLDPARHYLLHGWREGRDPSHAFSTSQYLARNPDVAQAHVNPLVHYLRHGRTEGRAALIEQSLDSQEPELAALSAKAIDAEVDDLRRSGLFDETFYLSMYTDISPRPSDPIRHYCEQGWREGRNPSDNFDTGFYLATYSDIRLAGINPFWHYVVAGASELRHALPDLATRFEDDVWFGPVYSDVNLIARYAHVNWDALRKGRAAAIGHPQPSLPHESVGFADQLQADTLRVQAELARRHGVGTFCFDLTEGEVVHATLARLLTHPDINVGLCVRLDLRSESLAPALLDLIARAALDRRSLRVDGRPVMVLVLSPEAQHAIDRLHRLKKALVERGIGHPFLIAGQANGQVSGEPMHSESMFDAVVDLADQPIPFETGDFTPVETQGVDVVPYRVVASCGVDRAESAQPQKIPRYHSVTLGRDGSATPIVRPTFYSRFHIRDYRRWLAAAIDAARRLHPEDRRFVFLNAWNDWNKGLYLEPDRRGGFSRLNETARALLGRPQGEVMPKVSVVVPNFNHAPYLRRRLDSIYGQTYRNIEVILLDDCSSDDSRLILSEYASAHPEITRTVFNEYNSGSAFRQWARGIKAATGDLVWVAESDDFCDERFLEVIVRCFRDEAVMLAYSRCVFVDKSETPLPDEFRHHVSDLACAAKWERSYVETAHNEVREALGIKNTIPNASGAVFKRPVDLALLEDESWLSMVVAGDWVFYLHVLRGGKIAYTTGTTNYFRRYEGSAAELTYRKEVFYREVGLASRTVAALYDVPLEVLSGCRDSFKALYDHRLGRSDQEFADWYDHQAVLAARAGRVPNVMVCTMGFYPGGAEILPIRMANEFKRQGLSVLLLNAGLNPREDGVRRMLRNDVPLVETSDVGEMKAIIQAFGVEALNTHQWHIQKYPLQMPDVFADLGAHVASLHGMIEHGDAFGVTRDQLEAADKGVSTWVFTADKNIVPFKDMGLFDSVSKRFVKLPNGMQPPVVVPRSRAEMGIPEEVFVLCCVSRAIPDKGWAETIQVVERARAMTARDIRLILVGNGPVYDEYCRDGVPDFVHLAGFSEDSVGHYAAADMGIMLTRFKSESFPLTVVDCLFAGRPYIASDVGDIRNMLTLDDRIAGEVIALDNWQVPIEAVATVVARFASDPLAYEEVLERVATLAGRYRIDVVASQYVELFTRDCASHRRPEAS